LELRWIESLGKRVLVRGNLAEILRRISGPATLLLKSSMVARGENRAADADLRRVLWSSDSPGISGTLGDQRKSLSNAISTDFVDVRLIVRIRRRQRPEQATCRQ